MYHPETFRGFITFRAMAGVDYSTVIYPTGETVQSPLASVRSMHPRFMTHIID